MSTNLNYKQVANVERRTWDLEAYEKRAKERVKSDDNGDKKKRKSTESSLSSLGPQDDGEEQKEEFQRAARGAAGPAKSERAFLKARRNRVDLDSKIGSIEMINPEAVATTKSHVGEPGSIKDGITKTGVGWHCKVCDCFLRDSHTYLDHINGKKHQRNLGFSMRVERSTKYQVSSRLAMLAKEREKQKNLLTEDGEENFHDIVKAKDEEARRKKEERALQRKERKKMKKANAGQSPQEEGNDDGEEEAATEKIDESKIRKEEDVEVDEEEINPDLAAMMGFSGFQ